VSPVGESSEVSTIRLASVLYLSSQTLFCNLFFSLSGFRGFGAPPCSGGGGGDGGPAMVHKSLPFQGVVGRLLTVKQCNLPSGSPLLASGLQWIAI